MQSRAAIRYAKAIYEIALEQNSIKELYNDMDIIKSIYLWFFLFLFAGY